MKRPKPARSLIRIRYSLAILVALALCGCDVVPISTGPTVEVGHNTVLPTPTARSTSTASPTPTLTAAERATPPSTPTPEPTPTATERGTPTQTPPPPQSPTAQAWEGTITVNTYGWEAALIDTQPGDAIYPYPRLEQHLVQPPQPREYKTVVLENEYLRLTLLPELGGRIYRWLDKASGQEMFYANPVIKPTRWGARGWWLATGGMEWGFPVEEHGLVEWRPWGYEIVRDARGVGVRMTDTEDRTGLTLEITVLVEAGRAGYTVQPRIANPTDAEQSYQFWLNGMFALSPANRPSPDLRFTLPVDTVLVHSTGDKRLPEPNERMSWPIYEGIDVSRYGTWEGWLGVFALQTSYMGAYDPTSAMGVARVSPSAVSQGAKIFGPGTLDPGLWTDDESGYVELWGGLTPTFWDDTTLAPGASVTWQERWYGLNGLGGLSMANDRAALWLAPEEVVVQVGALTTRPLAGQLALLRDGETVQTWEAVFRPDAPFRATHPVEGGGRWELRLVDGGGQVVAAYTDRP